MSDESWIKTKEGITTIGLKEEVIKKAKEFVFIKLPKKGQKIEKGEEYLTIEAVKWSGHIESPVSGEVVDVNEDLEKDPSKLNKEPNMWIIKVKTK